MKWLRRILIVLVALPLLAAALAYATGYGAMVPLVAGFVFGAPSGAFDPAEAAPAPDYSDGANWAALPTRLDLADYVPSGVQGRDRTRQAPIDVFFIHPTGYLASDTWTSPMDPASATEENTRWMMANQASTYGGCCEVYAPRYREASIFTYFRAEPDEQERIMRFAYEDVERAFDYFLEHFSQGRPFVIASHSQGTHHGVVLLRERIDGTPLAERMVAAYLIGGGLATDEFAGMKEIGICDAPDELHCAIHWDTMSELGPPEPERASNVCVNPLTWKHQGGEAPKEAHVGGVPGSGVFTVKLLGDDAGQGTEFEPLAAPIPNHVSARCDDGVLYVTDQTGTAFTDGLPGGTNYHGLDYPLFHMDIRQNAILRARTYLAQREAEASR